MSKNGKRLINAGLISQFESIFRCPICFGAMKMVHLKSLICSNNHCFDVAKQGYVNMLSDSPKAKYNKEMFEWRRKICKSGFFEPLLECISQKIILERKCKSEPIKIIDAGCGEGSILTGIRKKIVTQEANDFLVGADISKEGIYCASAAYNNAIWCVADIANLPFASKQFDFILNILSPSNYSEFQRILSDDGMVIKVIPESEYLQELRAIFYKGTDRQVYSNANTVNRFAHHFELHKIERVIYRVALEQENIRPLALMTPLSWGTTEERLQKVMDMDVAEIKIDLTVLCGKKK